MSRNITTSLFLLLLAKACWTRPIQSSSSTSPYEGRIVGGWETDISYFPYQVSVQVMDTHVCGGTVIAEDLILTAAHCLTRFSSPQYYSVRAGSSYSFRDGVVIPAKAIKIHENYKSSEHDIAVIKLAMPLVYSTKIKPITLWNEDVQIADNTQLWVSGWGSQLSWYPQIASVLRYTSVNSIDLEKCRQAYKTLNNITENMLCAGTTVGGRDSCQGDSGGPLVARHNNNTKLVGIVSFGMGCGKAEYPGVYTRVQKYHKWLKQTINELK
ncbi:trypsin-4 [Musca autumnalis]|uniref:trypsin-4 n=1 Tax=Musca autumnalis TaxID=221902 RepID=UPI003CEA1B07